MYFTQRERHIEALWVCWLTHFSMCVSYRHEWRRGLFDDMLRGTTTVPLCARMKNTWKLLMPYAASVVPPNFTRIFNITVNTFFQKCLCVQSGFKNSNCGIQCVHDLGNKLWQDPCLCQGRYHRHNVFLLRQWLDTGSSLLHYRELDGEVVMF